MFIENFEKYMRERLLPNVTLDVTDNHFTLTDKDGNNLIFMVSGLVSDTSGDNEFEVFSKYSTSIELIDTDMYDYYLTYEESDFDDEIEYIPYEDAQPLGSDDDEAFYQWWWDISDVIQEYPFMGNYFDTTKKR